MKLNFDKQNFVPYEATGLLIKKQTVGNFLRLFDHVMQSLSVGNVIEIADSWRGMFQGQLPSGEVFSKENVAIGEKLLIMPLLRFVEELNIENLPDEKRDLVIMEISNFKLMMQRLLQSHEDTVEINSLLQWDRLPRENSRIGNIYNSLFANHPDKLIALFTTITASLTLHEISQIAFMKGLVKDGEVDSIAELVKIGIMADTITMRQAVEKILETKFPGRHIVDFQGKNIKGRCFKVKDVLAVLFPELWKNPFDAFAISGWCLEKLSLKDFMKYVKEMFSGISLFDLLRYGCKDYFTPPTGQEPFDLDRAFVKGCELKKTSLRNIYDLFPPNHPLSVNLKIALRRIGVAVENLNPARDCGIGMSAEDLAAVGALSTTDPAYISNLLNNLRLHTVFHMILDCGFFNLDLDETFSEAAYMPRGWKIRWVKLIDMTEMLTRKGKAESENTFVKEFWDQLRLNGEDGEYGMVQELFDPKLV